MQLRLEAGRTRVIEDQTIRGADALLTVTEEERALALEHAADKPAFIVPNWVEVNESPTFDEREGLVFFGGFLAGAGSPNEDAVLHLAESILPLVWREHPELTLTVIGADVTPAVQALVSDRIRVVGYVDDPVAWLARARVHVSPIRAGAGIKLKLLDSMAAGLPFVTTPAGAEGLHLGRVTDLVVGESPAQLAALVTALATDRLRWESVQRVLWHNAETHFSRAAFRRSLVEAMSHVGVAPPPAAAWLDEATLTPA
jgi:glycosyltransferase involved in cell wall biosynthesis